MIFKVKLTLVLPSIAFVVCEESESHYNNNENDNTLKFTKHVSTETSVIFS